MVTHAEDNVDRSALALLLAEVDAKRVRKELSGVTIRFALPGVKFCRKGAAESHLPDLQ